MQGIKGFLSVTGMMLALSSWAMPQQEQLQMTRCLADKLPVSYPVLAENGVFSILSVPFADVEKVARIADTAACGRFVNVTDALVQHKQPLALAAQNLLQIQGKSHLRTDAGLSYTIHHTDVVHELIPKVDPEAIWKTLNTLTAFHNRSATKKTGIETAQWLKDTVDNMAREQGRDDVETRFVATGRYYKQPSLVTVIGKHLKKPGIVIGAHMDTLDGRMPGAGDDGSGSAVVMEMTRLLLAHRFAQDRPLYIIWYAAEERGLVGSHYVVQDFRDKEIPVAAAIQFDMSGYRSDPKDPALWVFQDYTDPKLNLFVESLIKEYVRVPVKHSQCGYGCSDHASWTAEGIPAAFPCESSFEEHNPYIHTASDDLYLLNEEHLVNFTKLAVAFAMEMSMH